MSANTTPAVFSPSPFVPLSEVLETAKIIVQSGLFPAFKTPQAAAALMLLCRSKGLDPMQAIERYHIVQGRPVMRADAMLSEFIGGGGRVEWHERTDKIARATFSHPQGGSVEVSWTIEQAKAAGLTSKDVWRQYPRQMLHARCVSEGVRSVYPSATNGLYSPEEAENMEPIRATVASVETPQSAPAIEAKPAMTPAQIEARRQLIDAQKRFAAECIARKLDVLNDKGEPSGKKLEALADSLLPIDTANGETPYDFGAAATWNIALDRLKATPAPTDLGELADPFGPDEDGGRLL